MKRLLSVILFSLLLPTSVQAAARFWVPLTITGAISGTGGLCRLTVNDTTNLTAGNAVIVAGILGATACDGTTTVTTVVDATHVEVNLAFGLAYTSGGTLAGGNWTATGTGNWASSSGSTGGQTVPGASDTATFDGSSGGGTVVLNFGGTIALQSVTMGAFTGTWDNSVNNNNMTLSGGAPGAFNVSGSGARVIKLGTATYTLSSTTQNATVALFSTTTNMTLTAGSETWVISGVTPNLRIFATPSTTLLLGALTVNTNGGLIYIAGGFNSTFTTVTLNGGTGMIPANGIVATTLNWNALSTGKQIFIGSNGYGTQVTISVASGTQNMSWVGLRDVSFSGGATFTATNSFDLGDNTGVTITAPSASSGGGCILGGWLLWRDMPEHLNDNFPAWLEKTG